MKSSKFCLLLFAPSLLGTHAAHAKVVLTISKPAPKPAIVVTSRIVGQDASQLTVNLSVTNRQKTWYYVNASKHTKGVTVPDSFLLGPSQTYTINNVQLIGSQSGSFSADSSLTRYKEVPWALGIDAMYRVGLGASLPTKFQKAVDQLIQLLSNTQSSSSDRTQLLSSLNAYTAALKRKDVEACAKAIQSMAYNPLSGSSLYAVDQATATKFKSNISKLTTTKLLAGARNVAQAQIAALNAPKTDGVTYNTKFIGPPELMVSNVHVREGDVAHWAKVEVKLSNSLKQPVSADFSTADGTAKAGQDYIANSGTVNFPAGSTSQTIYVQILGDLNSAPDKSFRVRFSNPSDGLPVPKNTSTVTIIDDDKVSTTPSNNGKIVYVLDGNICVMNADGTNKTRLTSDTRSGSPSFSPDGSKIVFSSSRDHDSEIYIMDADGKNVKQLTKNPHYDGDPKFSPDGSKIVFAFESEYFGSFTQGGIYLMNTDGTGKKQLTNSLNDGCEYDSDPTFSPDGSKIVFSRKFPFPEVEPKAYVMNPDGTDKAYLNNEGDSFEFSPDGSKIAFIGEDDVYTMNADGTDRVQLTNVNHGIFDNSYSPTFSPDGSKIAFSRYLYIAPYIDEEIIYVMNPDGTNTTPLVDGGHPFWAKGTVPAPSVAASSVLAPSVPTPPAPTSPPPSVFPSGGAS